VGAELLEYREGELQGGSVDELVELGLYEGWVPMEVYRLLGGRQDVRESTETRLGGWQYVTSYRRLPDDDILAAQVPLQAGATAIRSADVAELLGGAIGFNLLFGMPLWSGALLTVLLEVFLIVSQRYHRIEVIIMGFLGIIGVCYLVEILIVRPDWVELAPSIVVPSINRSSIYVAMAILGAVVMPHNIFLHSNVIHSRKWGISEGEKMALLRYEKVDTLSAMLLGWLVNSAMIIVTAAVFFRHHVVVDSIEQASATLKPLAGPLAGLLFAVALVFAGVGSSVTSSMAEVNVITGFMGRPEDPRTLLYRISVFVTAIPSFMIILLAMDTFRILLFSQVVLSIQLPFTLIPLLILCRDRKVMGCFRSSPLEFGAAVVISAVVIILNIYLLYSTIAGGP